MQAQNVAPNPVKGLSLCLRCRRIRFYHAFVLAFCLVSAWFLLPQVQNSTVLLISHKHRPKNASAITSLCRRLNSQMGPQSDFFSRSHSDRFEDGTRPTLIQNAKIWTGRKNGTEVLRADILLDKGVIKSIGHLRGPTIHQYGKELVAIDANGAWVTPGLVDIHSHLGVSSLPSLSGASSADSHQGIIQPWLRSLDGLSTHDDSYPLLIAGGVTTSLVLPGSDNAIGNLVGIMCERNANHFPGRWPGICHQTPGNKGKIPLIYVTGATISDQHFLS